MNRIAMVIALTTFVAGCSVTATMLPVEGPLSQKKPVPVLKVKADGIMGNSGNVTFTMPDGEPCSGRWSSAAAAGVAVTSGSLIGQYGTTYLSGVSVMTGSGQNPGQALATCRSGRTFQIEFITGAGTAHGFGIGKDNEGNIYKFVF
jgi:hypothetical protein